MTSGGNGPRSSSNVYGVFKECFCVLGFVSCVLTMEPLSFDSPAETNSQKVPYIRKGFCVRLSRDSNPRSPARQLHTLASQPQKLCDSPYEEAVRAPIP